MYIMYNKIDLRKINKKQYRLINLKKLVLKE